MSARAGTGDGDGMRGDGRAIRIETSDEPLLAERKAAARKLALAARAEAHRSERMRASAALAEHVGGITGKVVASYLPIHSEADPLPAMVALAQRNRVAVPVIAGPELPLVFREWEAKAPLQVGEFGVMVPVSGRVLVPDVLIVPLVAFDRRLYRLGYGGGFYDRTLAALRAVRPVRAIGFGYAAQGVEALPLEPTDQVLDELVTEAGAQTAAD